MSKPILYGFPLSTFVRTARIVLAEKGVDYELQNVDLGSTEYRQLHPFGKVPAFRHDDLVLCETLAIADYVDHAFEGPALQPSVPADKARMLAWVSASNDYYYGTLIRKIVLQRFVSITRQ